MDSSSRVSNSARGQWMAFVLGLFAIGGALYCVTINQPWVAGTMLTTVFGAVTAAFYVK